MGVAERSAALWPSLSDVFAEFSGTSHGVSGQFLVGVCLLQLLDLDESVLLQDRILVHGLDWPEHGVGRKRVFCVFGYDVDHHQSDSDVYHAECAGVQRVDSDGAFGFCPVEAD